MLRRSLPLSGSAWVGRRATCVYKCGEACFRPAPNRGGNEPFEAVVGLLASRRAVLKGGLVAAVVLGTGCRVAGEAPSGTQRRGQAPGALTFTPVEPTTMDDVVVSDGYGWEVLLRWGEPILEGAPEFDFGAQTAAGQAGQFGYNCDFLAYLRMGDATVLWVNHEFTNPEIMLPDWNPDAPTREHVDIEMAAIGGSVVAIEATGGGRYRAVPAHPLNRRVTVATPMALTGPAAGSALLRTSEDPTGTRVLGMLNNCAGGITPWGTVLTGEENIDNFFGNFEAVSDPRVRALHDRMGFDEGPSTHRWELHYPRFDLGKEPNEPFRFGWVVEIDPADPSFVPRKRTALGRFKHEGATPKIAGDGRVAFYLGDDQAFEYVYKFVTAAIFREGDREHNLSLLDEGTLYVARFDADGTGVWLPLVHGEAGLDEANGFSSQADVVINARAAGDAAGATPMDRPEDVEANPVNGKIYASFTQNTRRGTGGDPGTDPANPRPDNTCGHVIEIAEDGGDAAAAAFTWEIFLLCGDPEDPSTFFAGFPSDQVSPIATPDNLTFDSHGNLWIATDGQADALGANDGYYAVPVDGPDRGHVRRFASIPRGAEACGPAFSPDGQTFFAAVQHPGRDGTLTQPLSDWPDRIQPPRPSVITIWKRQGDPRIGS